MSLYLEYLFSGFSIFRKYITIITITTSATYSVSYSSAPELEKPKVQYCSTHHTPCPSIYLKHISFYSSGDLFATNFPLIIAGFYSDTTALYLAPPTHLSYHSSILCISLPPPAPAGACLEPMRA